MRPELPCCHSINDFALDVDGTRTDGSGFVLVDPFNAAGVGYSRGLGHTINLNNGGSKTIATFTLHVCSKRRGSRAHEFEAREIEGFHCGILRQSDYQWRDEWCRLNFVILDRPQKALWFEAAQ